jgi:hypothetical protein
MASVIQKSRRIARRGMVVLSVTATMAISGVAFASWTLSGTGTGAAEATVASSLDVDIEAVNLYPGAEASAEITIENPNPFPVLITAVTFDSEADVTVTGGIAGDGDACSTSNAAVTFNNLTGLSIEVPAADGDDAGVATAQLSAAVEMGTNSANRCQSASFTKPFSVTAVIDN